MDFQTDPRIWGRCQILLQILSEFKQIDWLLFPLKSENLFL